MTYIGYITLYYLIGLIVSFYMIWFYRFSIKTKRRPKVMDSFGGLIGPWIWPLQIIKHVIDNYIK